MGNWLRTAGYVCEKGSAAGSKAKYQGAFYCISSTSKALITSFLSIGTCGGALSGAFVADYLGRKKGSELISLWLKFITPL